MSSNLKKLGNYYNDIGMLRWAGLGIAMANSPQEVLDISDRITGTNNEAGILSAIETYILPLVTGKK